MSINKKKSRCPLNYGLEVFGDHWSLLIIRELMLKGKRSYNELLAIDEGISTNILAARLRHLKREGLVSAQTDTRHSQKRLYYLTPKGLDLFPVILSIGIWSDQYGKNLWKAQQVFFGNRKSSAKTQREVFKKIQAAHQP